MTFIRTSFALNDILSLGVKKGSVSLSLSTGCSHSDGSHSSPQPPTPEQLHQERSPGGGCASQPGPGTCCLATCRPAMLTSGERAAGRCPPRTGVCPLAGGAGSRPAGAAPPDWASSLIIPFMRAGAGAFHGAWLRSLRGKFLAAEFMSCTFI